MKPLIAAFFVVALLFALLAIETWWHSRKGPAGWGDRASAFLMLVVGALVLLLAVLLSHGAHARDLGQWEGSNPAIREWYQSLMQPDQPQTSCCGEADAYWADEVHIRDGKTFVTITDDRDDAPLGRPHVDVGTVIEIPAYKLKWDRSNPTGHGVVFLSRQGFVFCYVQGTGI